MKSLKIIYIAVFFLICAAPSLLMGILGGSGTAEKRTFAPMPKLITGSGLNSKFGDGFDAYISDRFAFRQQLVTLNALISHKIFGTSSEDSVIAGKDGWLFFAQTVDSYTVRNSPDRQEVLDITEDLYAVKEYCEDKGADFIFTVAPNKNTVYGEYMPDNYLRVFDLQMYDIFGYRYPVYLDNSPPFPNYCNLISVLTDGASEAAPELLYHKWDSHWNNRGALLAYRTVMDFSGIPYDGYAGISPQLLRDWDGDLYGMLYPSLNEKDWQYHYGIDFTYEITSPYISPEDVTVTTENPNGNGKLLVYRDSFCNALLPFFAQHFKEAYFSRITPYDLSLIDEFQPDLVIIEIAERNVPLLANNIQLARNNE
ncbi:MAG: hypothetical protein LBR54_04710 [Oscillospiraceae bacterium]|jgi:hypothetical protein|nr:hypothetical protein [Oscillospiraceae bacterium]